MSVNHNKLLNRLQVASFRHYGEVTGKLLSWNLSLNDDSVLREETVDMEVSFALINYVVLYIPCTACVPCGLVRCKCVDASSAKPEVHNTYRNATRGGPCDDHNSQQALKIWCSLAVCGCRERTDTQTHTRRHTDHITLHPIPGVK